MSYISDCVCKLHSTELSSRSCAQHTVLSAEQRYGGARAGQWRYTFSMSTFKFNAPAEVYFPPGPRRVYGVRFRKFDTGAEALQHLIEIVGADKLGGVVMESGDVRITANKIMELYASDAYPLPRTKNAT
jgi:hypothetical protein